MLGNSLKKLGTFMIDRAYKIEKVRNQILRLQKEDGQIMLKALPDHQICFEYFDYIGRQIYKNGEYQRPLMQAAVKELRQSGLLADGGVMVEVGANIGTHTIYASKEHEFDLIISLEPDPRSFYFLELNIGLNRLAEQVNAFQLAVGSEESVLKFKQEVRNRGFSRIVPDKTSNVETIEVQVVSLDNFLRQENVESSEINLMWIDVEGYELQVLKGMEGILEFMPSICIEFSPSLYTKETQKELVDLIFMSYPKVRSFRDSAFELISSDNLRNSEKNTDLLLTRS